MTLIIIVLKRKIKASALLLTLLNLAFLFITTGSTSYDPEFDLPLANLTAKQGTDISFTCVVKHLREYRVAWIKSDDKAILAWHTNMVTNNHRYSVTHNGHNTWTLHIKNVQQNDSGTFMCQVNTDPMRMQVGTLEVVVPADIIDEETPSDVVVVEGQSVTLQCKATGYPAPKIRWKRKDGQPLPLSREVSNPGEIVYTWEGEMLPLKPLSREHTGTYFCIANNSHPPHVSKRVQVSVHIPPKLKVTLQLVGAPIDINATLECEVESVPKAFISWGTKDGQKLIVNSLEGKYILANEVINDYKMRAKLTILNLQKEDFTDYNVTARNAMGEETGVIKLHRLPPPETPRPSTTTTHRAMKHIDHYSSSGGNSGRLNNMTGGKHSKYHRKNPGGRGSHGSHGHSRHNPDSSDSSYYEDFESGGDGGLHHVTTTISNYNNNQHLGSVSNQNSINNARHHNHSGNVARSTPRPLWGKSAHDRSNAAHDPRQMQICTFSRLPCLVVIVALPFFV